MKIRPYQAQDESAVIALWQDCGLTRPWNDPRKDIARKLTTQPELFLVGTLDAVLVFRPALPSCARAALRSRKSRNPCRAGLR
jgi:hypothetical protein